MSSAAPAPAHAHVASGHAYGQRPPNVVPPSFSLKLSSADHSACLYDGDKLKWRATRAVLIGTVMQYNLTAGRIIKGSYDRFDANNAGVAALAEYNSLTVSIFYLLLRIIKHDVESGTSLREHILQLVAQNEMEDENGVELMAFLDQRASFASPAERREAYAEMKGMKMDISMSRTDVDKFATKLADLHSRCAPAQQTEAGTLSDLLITKLPEVCTSAREGLRLHLDTQHTLHGVTPTYETVKQLVAGVLLNKRLETPTALAAVAPQLQQGNTTVEQRLEAISKQLALMGRPNNNNNVMKKKCRNCGGRCQDWNKCNADACSTCGLKFCGASRGVPCMIAASSMPPDDAMDGAGRVLSDGFRRLLEKKRKEYREGRKGAAANISVVGGADAPLQFSFSGVTVADAPLHMLIDTNEMYATSEHELYETGTVDEDSTPDMMASHECTLTVCDDCTRDAT